MPRAKTPQLGCQRSRERKEVVATIAETAVIFAAGPPGSSVHAGRPSPRYSSPSATPPLTIDVPVDRSTKISSS